MNYLVVGAGSTGASLAGFLSAGGREVDVIARGPHLDAIQKNGLLLRDCTRGEITARVNACTAQEYSGQPDVIFICVKGYSLDEILPLLENAAGKTTVVIPVLNIVGTGKKLAQKLAAGLILDGCIYISAFISGPGEVTKGSAAVRVVFGERDGKNEHRALLEKIAADLEDCGIGAGVSEHIERDAFRKYLFISPFAAAGAYLNANAGQLLGGEGKALFLALNAELQAITTAMGIDFDEDMANAALGSLRSMPSDGTTSLQKDLTRGGQSELDGLVSEPVRLGRQYGVPTPQYEKVAAKLCSGAIK